MHVLLPDALQTRASTVPGSREMLERAVPALYARRVIAENNDDLPRRLSPRRVGVEMRWAWLLEGALRDAFGGRSPARTEAAWREHLARMAAG
jgi:hypothetical protein